MALNVFLLLLSIFAVQLNFSSSLSYAPILQQKFGPLYEGIKLLLADEQFNAQLVWNETAQHLNDTSALLKQAIDALTHYNPVEHLKTLNELTKNPNFFHCYKDYEREIAHFDREFIIKYEVCKQTLNVAASHLEDETFEEINFLRNATFEIQRICTICKLSDLKYAHKNHAGIVMCVISRLGQIDQRLAESTQLVVDIISEIAAGTDIDADSCHDFNELKLEFNDVFLVINNCVNEV